jgi:DNA-binding NtrC family response regulator
VAQVEVIVVDDDAAHLNLEAEFLKEAGLRARAFSDPLTAWEAISRGGARVVVSDWEMPGLSGLDLLFKVRGLRQPPQYILVTGHGSVDRAVQALKHGALAFLEKPLRKADFLAAVKEALDRSRGLVAPEEAEEEGEELVAEAPASRAVLEVARAVAPADSAVLLLGETGSGKEMLAEYIHRHSRRARGPLVKVNCGALPEHLIESELFGHERGAFTGAERRRIGRFEQASGGSLFLDEVGDLAAPLQVKLLRALQEKIIERVGGEAPIAVDFRLICATHLDLAAAVAAGRFREDLYYRINVIPICPPPLRQRIEDLEPLARRFLGRLRDRLPGSPAGFSPEALACLRAYSWPGNVRQLRNAVEYAVVMAKGELIQPADLPRDVREGVTSRPASDASPPVAQDEDWRTPALLDLPRQKGLDEALGQVEAALLRAALERRDWKIEEVMKELRVGRTRLYVRMKTYGLQKPGEEDRETTTDAV